MCRDAVAAPRALQLIVYPIFLKKSLHFCEKSKKFLKLCTALRKKYKMKRLRRKTELPQSKPAVLPAPSGREPLARPQALHFSRKLYRYAKGPILEGAVERSETGGVFPGVRLLRLFCRGHPAPTSASPVLFCTSSSCPVRLESRAM